MAGADGDERLQGGANSMKLFDPFLDLFKLGGDLLLNVRTVSAGIRAEGEKLFNVAQ